MKQEDLIRLCKKLNIIDYKDILKDSSNKKDKSSLSTGPPWYPGSKYGTFSIKDFKFY